MLVCLHSTPSCPLNSALIISVSSVMPTEILSSTNGASSRGLALQGHNWTTVGKGRLSTSVGVVRLAERTHQYQFSSWLIGIVHTHKNVCLCSTASFPLNSALIISVSPCLRRSCPQPMVPAREGRHRKDANGPLWARDGCWLLYVP